jgi:hypothetical protein
MRQKSGLNIFKYYFVFSIINKIYINNIMSSFTSNVTAYPQGLLNRSSNYITLFNTTLLPYNKTYNNCSNTLCYTASKGTFVYQPHTAYGMVGTSAASYLARRRRL